MCGLVRCQHGLKKKIDVKDPGGPLVGELLVLLPPSTPILPFAWTVREREKGRKGRFCARLKELY